MLAKMTVKELREIAKRMDLKIPGVALSRATKDLLITGIEALTELDHIEALEMNKRLSSHPSAEMIETGDAPEDRELSMRFANDPYSFSGSISSIKGAQKRLSARIERDHHEGLKMNARLGVPTSFDAGGGIILTGDTARIMNYHMSNVRRFNPSGSLDNDGRIRLTPKQLRRCSKKLIRFMKRENLWGTKNA